MHARGEGHILYIEARQWECHRPEGSCEERRPFKERGKREGRIKPQHISRAQEQALVGGNGQLGNHGVKQNVSFEMSWLMSVGNFFTFTVSLLYFWTRSLRH